MLLRDFCIVDPAGYQGVAERAGEHRGTIHRIAHGRLGYSPERGLKICAATLGKVSMDDLARPFAPSFVMPPAPTKPKRRQRDSSREHAA